MVPMIDGVDHIMGGVIPPAIAPMAPGGGPPPNSPNLAEPAHTRSNFVETWLYQSFVTK